MTLDLSYLEQSCRLCSANPFPSLAGPLCSPAPRGWRVGRHADCPLYSGLGHMELSTAGPARSLPAPWTSTTQPLPTSDPTRTASPLATIPSPGPDLPPALSSSPAAHDIPWPFWRLYKEGWEGKSDPFPAPNTLPQPKTHPDIDPAGRQGGHRQLLGFTLVAFTLRQERKSGTCSRGIRQELDLGKAGEREDASRGTGGLSVALTFP